MTSKKTTAATVSRPVCKFAQARAALTAAQQLHTVRFAPPRPPPGPPRARTAADLAAQSFTGPRYRHAARGPRREARTR